MRLSRLSAVDDTTVEVVKIRGREAPTVELHHGAQVRGEHREDVKTIDLGSRACRAERVHNLEALVSARVFAL